VELIPAIDLLGGQVVRLAQGDYEQVTVYGTDPIAVARRWAAEGAARLHLVDLDGARLGRPIQADLIAEILVAAGIPCQVAGGLRDAEAVANMLTSGADRAVLGSALLRDPMLATTLVDRHGSDAIVAAIDVRDGQALGDGWVAGTPGSPAMTHVARLADAGIGWFAVTAIARDGLQAGPDLELLEQAATAARGAAIIASAGVATVEDIGQLARRGFAGAILGRALYEGTLSLPQALRAVAAG
jgi:phosphoribosylformimino-5-aminoimidazole carboxamide ribotide isomerase